MAGPIRISILADSRGAVAGINATTSSAQRMGDRIAKYGTRAVAGLGLITVAAGKMGFDAVQAASDLEESINKTEVVFGKQARSIIAWSETTADAFGLPQQEALAASSTFGDMFSQLGFGTRETAKLSTGVVDLAGDLGSFHNLDTAEVLDQIGAAMRGEYDSLQRLVPTINAAAVETEALRQTGKKSADALTAQEKATATLALITRGSKNAIGDAARTHDSFANSSKRLTAKVDDLQAKIGKALLPVALDLVHWAEDEIVPAVESKLIPAIQDATEWFEANKDEIADLAKEWGGRFLGVIEDTWSVLQPVLGLIQDIPDPLKDTAFQMGLVYAAVNRLNPLLQPLATGLGAAASGLGSLATQGRRAQGAVDGAAAATKRMSTEARVTAGATGLGGLAVAFAGAKSDGADFSDYLTGTLSGALTGLAVGGPIGALIGGAGGAGLTALGGAFAETEEEAAAARLELLRTEGFAQARQDADKLSEALHGVVRNYGNVSRAAVKASFIGEEGKLDSDIQTLRGLGVSMDTITSAALGQADAQRIVNAAWDEGLTGLTANADAAHQAYLGARDGAIDLTTATGEVIKNGQQIDDDAVQAYKDAWLEAQGAVDEVTASQETFNARIDENTGAIADHRTQVRDLAGELGITVKQYNRWPKRVRTKIESEGLPQTSRDALRLIGDYKGLQKFKNIKAVVDAPGVDLTRRQVRTLQRQYDLTPKQVKTLLKSEGLDDTKASLKGWLKGIDTAMNEGATLSEREQRVIKTKLESIEEARPDLAPYVNEIRTKVNSAKTTASSESTGVGNALKQGLLSGMYGTGPALSAIMTSAVREAIRDARAEADANSPSRETERLGRDLGEGLARGAEETGDRTRKAGRGMVLSLLAGVTGGLPGVQSAIEKINTLIEKRINLKDDKKERAREKEIIGNLDKMYDRLRRNGKAQDEINKKLAQARDHLAEVSDWVGTIRQSFVETGNLINLGRLDDNTVSGTLLVDQLRGKVNTALRFAELVRQLSDGIGKDLSRAALDQLLAAGPEAAIATAEALAAGGDAAITEVNNLTSQLAAAGQSLGTTMSNEFFDIGLNAAQGIVDGLEAQQKRLDRIAERLAERLAKAVEKALGIKSPSRVFRDIGDEVTKGLVIGLDDTYVKRQASRLAGSLADGFGRPALEAHAAAQSPSTGPQRLRITLTADQVSQLQRGREIQADLDAWNRAGGRRSP